MIYSDLPFLLAFPVFLAGYALLPAGAARRIALLAASLAFYAYGEPAGLPVLAAVIAIAWATPLLAAGRPVRVRVLQPLAIAALVGLLALFKVRGGVPLGLSFFTFEAIAYLVDVRRGVTPVERSPLRLALFVSVFPHLISGPILRPNDILPRLRAPIRIERTAFASGLALFVEGLVKKRVIADTAGLVADQVFGAPGSVSTLAAWVGALAYTAQIYGDFAGYTDMGRGVGRMLGLELPRNFDAPYTATSIREFWRRWHISLSSWLRDYLYIPLGGDRRGRARTYLNLMATMVLGGLWHGVGLTFVGWGAFHGALIALDRATGWTARLPRLVAGALTLFLVVNGWVLFRAPDLGSYIALLQALYVPRGGAFLSRQLLLAGLGPFVLVLGGMLAARRWPAALERLRSAGPLPGAAYAAVAWAVVVFAPAAVRPFIYFRF